jgi:hypothetical protein
MSAVIDRNPILDLVHDIVEKSNQPMSPDEIKGRFQLNFPFTVRRVIEGTAACACGEPYNAVGALLTFVEFSDTGSYVYADCNCDTFSQLCILPDAKRFVLV